VTPEEYLSLAQGCRSQNEFNRLHIGIENIATPPEMAGLSVLTARDGLPAASRSWLDTTRQFEPTVFSSPQGFERRALSKCVTIYEDRRAAPPQKGLLVAFTGNARRMMMPIPVFLQFIDSSAWDVVVVHKGSRASYLLGVEELADDLPSAARAIAEAASARNHRRTLTMGVSGGGAAAILAAIFVGVERGISVCGAPPKMPPPALGPALAEAQAAGTRPQLRLVYGTESPHDRQSALALQRAFGGELFPIPGIANHNVLAVLQRQGELAGYMRSVLN
jgi:hypothetical protein